MLLIIFNSLKKTKNLMTKKVIYFKKLVLQPFEANQTVFYYCINIRV